MYISHINVKNFRKLENLSLDFNKDLNFIIGENDSGKTALIDAIKISLGTVSNDYIRLNNDDFYDLSKDIIIELYLKDFNEDQQVQFLDWGGEDDDGKFGIKLRFKAEKKGDKIFSKVLAGPIESEEEGRYLEPDIKELLNSVYLKPLRDVENELSASRNSRLSKILIGHKNFRNQENHELVSKFNHLNGEIKNYFSRTGDEDFENINEKINKILKDIIGEDDHKEILIDTGVINLQNILEKLNLKFEDNKKPGLGTNNLLFIASELLLLNERSQQGLGVALIEELEAHIHPQKQLTLIDYLQKQSKDNNIQMFITSHSPNIASKVDLKNIIICKNANFYPLKSGKTLLNSNDYKFLERFLDVTKSDLFFARGIIFVEGIAEAILMPTIANLFGIDLNKQGISIINLNGLSFERYLKVFISSNNENYLGIKIACVTDRDGIRNNNGTEAEKKKMNKGDFEQLIESGLIEANFKDINYNYSGLETIRYFYNKIKTLEFDLAVGNLFGNLLQARENVKGIQNKQDIVDEGNKYKKAYMLYEKIENSKGDFAQELASIWEGGDIIKQGIIDGKNQEDIIIEVNTYKEALKQRIIDDPYIRYILKALEHVTGRNILPTHEGQDE